METTARCVSMGPAHCKERLQNPVRFSSRLNSKNDESHSGGSRAGSGNGTRSRYSLKEGGHRGGPPHERVRVLQLVLHSSREGWRVASHFRSASVEPFSQQTEVQDAQTGRVSDQVRGLVCHDRSNRCIFPCLHPSHSQKFLRFAFGGEAYQYRVLSSALALSTPHFYEVCGCRVSSVAATRHPHTQLHQRLVDSRSIRSHAAQHQEICPQSCHVEKGGPIASLLRFP